jgi:ABC-2 type transport system ATP-binding protein
MHPVISIQGLTKTYAGGFEALKAVDLEIERGEIFGLLGPNGAGKTTLINIVCGIVNATGGSVLVNGDDIVTDFRKTRSLIGLVPQELPTDTFETVINNLRFSRGLFGLAPDEAHVEKVLNWLSLWEKRNTPIMALSGGMKRRVLIAKALVHEPDILFLDEPTAGVDVELRQDMWNVVKSLREQGVTVILTTHYIEEAEKLADRIGVINHGEIILIEEKAKLMRDLGRKQLSLHLADILDEIPAELQRFSLELGEGQRELVYTYDTRGEHTGITDLINALRDAGIRFNDLQTSQSSLEEIFVDLVRRQR